MQNFPPPNGGDPNADAAAAAAAGFIGLVFLGMYLLLIIAVVAGMWKCFEKAGKPGWAAIVPIYNLVVYLEITGKPLWQIILVFIPCIGPIFAILWAIDFAKVFGKGAGYGLGLAFLPFIFYPMLGFSKDRYLGPLPQG